MRSHEDALALGTGSLNMTEDRSNRRTWTALQRYPTLIHYGAAALAAWVALSLWVLTPILHRDPFLAAVVITARFCGFGPAILCTLVSAACLDLVVFPPHFSFAIASQQDLGRLSIFLAIALVVGSLARQKTQAQLRAEDATREMATIVECSEDAIFGTDTNGVVTSWNRGAERLYGFSAEEAVGAHVELLGPPERRAEMARNQRALNRGGRVEPYQTERMRKDGTHVPVLLSISSLRNDRGEVVGAYAVARDISAQKLSEEAIRRSEKLATAGRLAASVAHEINNPLEAVLNLLYLARNDPGRAEQYLSMAEREVGRVASLAQQTLGFVREANSPALANPAQIMDEVLALYSRKLESKKICVLREYGPDCEIIGYPGELRQLLANLLVNAVDALPPGGNLRVRVAAGHEWRNGAPGVRITVADNGRGIPRESRDRIFEAFYTTKKDAGTGLGLWVSQGIVQKHHGSIRVRSRTDGAVSGTVFSIFLPRPEHSASRVA